MLSVPSSLVSSAGKFLIGLGRRPRTRAQREIRGLHARGLVEERHELPDLVVGQRWAEARRGRHLCPVFHEPEGLGRIGHTRRPEKIRRFWIEPFRDIRCLETGPAMVDGAIVG